MNLENIKATKEIKDYFYNLNNNIQTIVNLAKSAKKKGRDISLDIESLPAPGIAEKTEILTGPVGVAKIYNKLWEKYKNREKVLMDIVDLILDKKLGNIEDPEKRLDQAIRTGLVILTEGVVVSPLDGIPEVKISKNPDGSKYVDIYFAGPIRAAGGTGQTWPLLLADYARKKLHLDKFKPTKKEIERLIEEVNIYQNEVVARQLRINDEEIKIIAENCPICINSGPDSEVEIVANRDLERIPTNRIRGAMCLVLIDGVFVRKMKILKISKKLGLNWSWLEKMIKAKKTSEGVFELKPSFKYLEGLAAGRPVFAHPSVAGGFRLRYGKARTTGIMAKAINPATMYVLDEFIAVGTHGKIERPGKALQFFPCSSIDGPIVKLITGEVIKLNSTKKAKEVLESISEVLFVGDILITIGDFKKSGHPLIKNGFVEEEWLALIKYLFKKQEINKDLYDKCIEFYNDPDPYRAVELSLNQKIPLFPKYIHYYDLLNKDELIKLIKYSRTSEKIFKDNYMIGAKIKNNLELKKILEKIGLPHKLDYENNIIIEEKYTYTFLKTTGALNAKDVFEEFNFDSFKTQTICEILSQICKIKICEKSGSWIGARMGRPEAAHERMMAGKPNVLFPIGHGYRNNRDIIRASQKKSDNAKAGEYGISEVDIRAYQCPICKKILFSPYCFKCKSQTNLIRYCPKCKKQLFEETCSTCNEITLAKTDHKINLDREIERACQNLKIACPEKIKAVKGLVSTKKVPEPLEKGVLRAKHNVFVFRDGTCRYEALNATISQFKAKELNLSVEKVKELGYKIDYLGNEIKSDNQIIDIFPQDIIVDDNCGDYFLRVSKFIDEELEKFYEVPKYYNLKTKNDLIGQLVIGLAPHTSAGIVGRIIGFSKSKLCWGHPFYITAKRRNVDGDQDSMLLLLDSLLNFSKSYLSDGRGGRMDAPLSFTNILDSYEVDDESYEIETVQEYPYELYLAAKTNEEINCEGMQYVLDVLGSEQQYNCIKFTHNTDIFDEGPKSSSYLTIKSMKDKVDKQGKLQKRIRAVDEKDALERLLQYHLFPDIIGNTRAFARQKLRCVKCNSKYRRIPLSGKCDCGGKLILTITQGSIKKYIQIAKDIIKNYELKPYLYQKISLSEDEINSLFSDKEEEKQKSLSDFF
jgi:DNA polymerase II large subunit